MICLINYRWLIFSSDSWSIRRASSNLINPKWCHSIGWMNERTKERPQCLLIVWNQYKLCVMSSCVSYLFRHSITTHHQLSFVYSSDVAPILDECLNMFAIEMSFSAYLTEFISVHIKGTGLGRVCYLIQYISILEPCTTLLCWPFPCYECIWQVLSLCLRFVYTSAI